MVSGFVFVKCLEERLAHIKPLDGCCHLMLGGGCGCWCHWHCPGVRQLKRHPFLGRLPHNGNHYSFWTQEAWRFLVDFKAHELAVVIRGSRPVCLSSPWPQPWLTPSPSQQSSFCYLSSPGYLAAAAAAKLLQSCPTLCDPTDGSPPSSSVPGILQARTLEWVTISFSSAGKWKVKVKTLSRFRLFETPWTAASQAPPSMGFSRQEYWSGCHCLLLLVTLRSL